jgi:hypothetical protein
MNPHGGFLISQVAASVFHQSKSAAFDLSVAGLVPELSHNLVYLAQTGSADGVSP